MKKFIAVISSIIITLGTISTVATANEKFLRMPIKDKCEPVYEDNAMRVSSMRSGFRAVVEYDVNFHAITGTKTYNFAFNYGTEPVIKNEKAQVCHNSAITVTDDKWKWKLEGSNSYIAENLDCGVNYHITVAVDLKAQKQYCSVTKKSDGTVIGYVHNVPLFNPIPENSVTSFTQHIRFYGSWLASEGEGWGNVKPTNVTVSREAAYVLDSPIITFSENSVTATAIAYHNIAAEIVSPTLILCIYDESGALVGITADKQNFDVKTSMWPEAHELTVTKSIALMPGMTAKAMVVNSIGQRSPFVGVVEASVPALP